MPEYTSKAVSVTAQSESPLLSIVICTHRRFDLLDGAVASLANQENVTAPFEVLVVDNDHAPNAEVQMVVARYSDRLDIRYIHEGRLGLSHARNTGGHAAAAEYVAYIDDDAKACPSLVAKWILHIAEYSPNIMGGPWLPFYLTQKPRWFRNAYGAGSLGDQERWLRNGEYLSGMNIIFRKALLDELGWFDPQHGMVGDTVWYGEETAVQIKARLVYPDIKVYYDPQAYVKHLVPRRKMSIMWKIKSSFQFGRSQTYFWLSPIEQSMSPTHLIWNLILIGMRLIWGFGPGLLLRDRHQYRYWQNYVFERLSRLIGSLGQTCRLLLDSCLHKNKCKCI